MAEYKTIKNPKALKGKMIDVDEENLAGGVDCAIGLDTDPDKPDAQLDIRYRGGNTYVSLAVDDSKGKRVPQEHWRFTGSVSPEDCRANWKAAQDVGKKQAAKTVDATADE